MPTETDKQDALVAFLEATLNAVKEDVNVSDRFRVARTGQKSEREKVMGTPPYYLEVEREGYQPDAPTQDRSTGGSPYLPWHRYGVRLWFDYEDKQDNKEEWDKLVEDANGLLPTLRQKETIQDSGDTFALGQPQEVQEVVVSLSNRQPQGELAHYLEFSILAQHSER